MAETSGAGDPTPIGGDAVDPHKTRISHYQDAAQLAVVGHPLPGEDLASPYLEDAQMWLRVYGELLAFKETLIADTDKALETLPLRHVRRWARQTRSSWRRKRSAFAIALLSGSVVARS